MIDLIYLEASESQQSIKDTILQRFPNAKFRDASDEVHWNRFEVEIPDATARDFFRLAASEGFALCCLGIGLAFTTQPHPNWVKEEMEELRRVPKNPNVRGE